VAPASAGSGAGCCRRGQRRRERVVVGGLHVAVVRVVLGQVSAPVEVDAAGRVAGRVVRLRLHRLLGRGVHDRGVDLGARGPVQEVVDGDGGVAVGLRHLRHVAIIVVGCHGRNR